MRPLVLTLETILYSVNFCRQNLLHTWISEDTRFRFPEPEVANPNKEDSIGNRSLASEEPAVMCTYSYRNTSIHIIKNKITLKEDLRLYNLEAENLRSSLETTAQIICPDPLISFPLLCLLPL